MVKLQTKLDLFDEACKFAELLSEARRTLKEWLQDPCNREKEKAMDEADAAVTAARRALADHIFNL
jgi:hypothetical protein